MPRMMGFLKRVADFRDFKTVAVLGLCIGLIDAYNIEIVFS
jgi:hypothetical protein